MMRIDKLFRQNLRRSLAHLHRITVDIRDRRFLYGVQTVLLSIFIYFGLGNLLASLAYNWRLNLAFGAFMEHFIGADAPLELIHSVVWIPYRGVLFFSLLLLGCVVLSSLIIKIGGSRRRARLSLVQAFYVLTWSAVPSLIVLPLSAFYFRVLTVPFFAWLIILASLWVVIWSYFRLIKALRIAYRSTALRPLVVCLGLPLLFLGAYLVHLQTVRQTLSSLSYIWGLGGPG